MNRFLLWAQLDRHRRAVDRAREAIADWLRLADKPYVAFSGGKDSTALLHLVREQKSDCPAVYFDADCAFPEVASLLDTTPSLIRQQTDEPLICTIQRLGLQSAALDRATMQPTVWGPVKRLVESHGFDGMAYGLRAQESRGRMLLGRSRGPVFRHGRDGVWACQPLTTWLYEDVWAYIAANDIPYAKTYDRMWDMPEREQRISYWAGETNVSNGRYVWLKRNYPDLFNRLAAALPEARCYA